MHNGYHKGATGLRQISSELQISIMKIRTSAHFNHTQPEK
jgi:hypothetical protein